MIQLSIDIEHTNENNLERANVLLALMSRVKAKSAFACWKERLQEGRRRQFQFTVYQCVYKCQYLRSLRKGFHAFLFQSQNNKVKVGTEDKRRVYTKYCRRLIQIKSRGQEASARYCFDHWKACSRIESCLEKMANENVISIEEEAH
mmetsp:Transcript_21800/g.33703  ORF Transcript_21800/g.33703 Transcript_21800/m.33703 type:complete len:147 (+) Transcript_21800:1063-1503(+)